MKTILLLALLIFPSRSYADRITEMNQYEECVYRARLAAGASYMRIAKLADSCATLKILWHGDETQYEIDYVSEWMCVGFEMNKDPIKTGDTVYFDCMKQE